MGLSTYTRDAKVAVSAQYFSEGFKGIGRVKALRLTNSPRAGVGFALEAEVLESNTDKDPVGSTRNHYIALSKAKYPEQAAGEVKQIIGVLIGHEPTDKEGIEYWVTDELSDAAVDDKLELFKGYLFRLEVGTPKEGKSFTKKFFTPMAQVGEVKNWQEHTGINS